jgi:hypothetical protein
MENLVVPRGFVNARSGVSQRGRAEADNPLAALAGPQSGRIYGPPRLGSRMGLPGGKISLGARILRWTPRFLPFQAIFWFPLTLAALSCPTWPFER